MKIDLPQAFENRMRDMLGDEFEEYVASYAHTRQFGLRINPLKTTEKDLQEKTSFHLSKIP